MLGKKDGHRVTARVYRTQAFFNPGDVNLATEHIHIAESREVEKAAEGPWIGPSLSVRALRGGAKHGP